MPEVLDGRMTARNVSVEAKGQRRQHNGWKHEVDEEEGKL